jgi:ribose transport system substrate-binding protein
LSRLATGRTVMSSVLAVTATLVLVACGSSSSSSSSASSSGSSSAAGSSGKIHIAFFGFAKANSFANATFKGIQQAAAANNADATFFDGNFSAPTQVSQIQDATVSGKYKVFIIQANDGSSVREAVIQAMNKGIKVVAEFTPIGTRYDTAAPQVPGVISIVDIPTANGKALADLAIKACAGQNPCNVAYLQGSPALPLDNARTAAVLKELGTDSSVKVVSSNLTGGYTQDTGRSAAQDLFQAHKDVNVVIGSSQAIEGAYPVAKQQGLAGHIKFIGNGGSIQAVKAVEDGQWFATYFEPEVTSGQKAAVLGIQAARGHSVATETNDQSYSPNGGLGTKAALAHVTSQYSDG